MKDTAENRKVVRAECARLSSISYLSEDALEGLSQVCVLKFPGVDSVSRAVTHFIETCDKVPPPVAFVRYAGAEATKVSARAYCRVCEGSGFGMQEMHQTLDGMRSVTMCYFCRCRAVEGQPVAPPLEQRMPAATQAAAVNAAERTA